MERVVLQPKPVDNLGHIEAKNEAQWNEAGTPIKVDTNSLKVKLRCFILVENISVEHTDCPVQQTVDQEIFLVVMTLYN